MPGRDHVYIHRLSNSGEQVVNLNGVGITILVIRVIIGMCGRLDLTLILNLTKLGRRFSRRHYLWNLLSSGLNLDVLKQWNFRLGSLSFIALIVKVNHVTKRCQIILLFLELCLELLFQFLKSQTCLFLQLIYLGL